MIILIICLLLPVLCIFMYMYSWKNYFDQHMKCIPGPRPSLFLGNVDLLLSCKKYDRLNLLMALLEKHGPILRIYVGPFFMIIFAADLKFLEFILSSTKLIDKSLAYSYLHSWLGTGLLTSSGEKWKKRRRMITPAFHFSILESFVEVFENVSDVFIEKLEYEVNKKCVNISPLLSLCTLDIICEAAMGAKLNAQNEKNLEYVDAVKTMLIICENRSTSILGNLTHFVYTLTPNYYKEKKALKILHGYTDSIIDNKITEKLNKPVDNENINFERKKKLAFLDLLLESTIDGKPLSRLEIREEVDTFMFEGHDTTSSAMGFAMYCLATNPAIQEKAVEEQKIIFEDCKNAKTTVSHLHEMKYLELIIKESLRLYPPVPILGRMLCEDVQWGGMVFPKRLNVFIPIYAIHRNPEFFDNPDEFRPERFLESNISNHFTYIPFSAGPRNCIGQKFAILEIKCILSKVLRSFELLPATPKQEPLLVPDVVLESANGICISLKKRKLF